MAKASASWTLGTTAPATPSSLPSGAGVAHNAPSFLGWGILTPFQRDQKNDFANGGGVDLLVSSVSTVLGVEATGPAGAGELPWRPRFGSLLYQLRHKPMTQTTQEIARSYVERALALWEPRVVVTQVTLAPGLTKRTAMIVTVRFVPISANAPNNRVVLPAQEVQIPIAA